MDSGEALLTPKATVLIGGVLLASTTAPALLAITEVPNLLSDKLCEKPLGTGVVLGWGMHVCLVFFLGLTLSTTVGCQKSVTGAIMRVLCVLMCLASLIFSSWALNWHDNETKCYSPWYSINKPTISYNQSLVDDCNLGINVMLLLTSIWPFSLTITAATIVCVVVAPMLFCVQLSRRQWPSNPFACCWRWSIMEEAGKPADRPSLWNMRMKPLVIWPIFALIGLGVAIPSLVTLGDSSDLVGKCRHPITDGVLWGSIMLLLLLFSLALGWSWPKQPPLWYGVIAGSISFACFLWSCWILNWTDTENWCAFSTYGSISSPSTGKPPGFPTQKSTDLVARNTLVGVWLVLMSLWPITFPVMAGSVYIIAAMFVLVAMLATCNGDLCGRFSAWYWQEMPWTENVPDPPKVDVVAERKAREDAERRAAAEAEMATGERYKREQEERRRREAAQAEKRKPESEPENTTMPEGSEDEIRYKESLARLEAARNKPDKPIKSKDDSDKPSSRKAMTMLKYKDDEDTDSGDQSAVSDDERSKAKANARLGRKKAERKQKAAREKVKGVKQRAKELAREKAAQRKREMLEMQDRPQDVKDSGSAPADGVQRVPTAPAFGAPGGPVSEQIEGQPKKYLNKFCGECGRKQDGPKDKFCRSCGAVLLGGDD